MLYLDLKSFIQIINRTRLLYINRAKQLKLMFDEHDIDVPPDVVREEIEVAVGLHADLHAAHHAVQRDVVVDRKHLGRKPEQTTLQPSSSIHNYFGVIKLDVMTELYSIFYS